MKENMLPYKGSRDFYPADKQLQSWMFDKWRIVAERYGYQEYDSPILERTELYLIKGSEEIVKDQTYTFKDRGDRSVTIRTEMTPSVSRMIARKRQEIAYPARWYSIPNLWRYERMQRGRSREFWQLNMDIFGVDSEYAELEMLQIVDDLFQEFGAKRSSYTIKINSRILVNTALKELAVDSDRHLEIVRLVDKKNKMSDDEFLAGLTEINGPELASNLKELFELKNLSELPNNLSKLESVKALKGLIETCSTQGINNVEFDLSLMRGFDYYTDIVFEVFDNAPDNNRSMFGGGRYDGLVGQFGVEPVPTVGFGMGDVTFLDFLTTNRLVPEFSANTDLVIIAKDEGLDDENMMLAKEIRELNLNVSSDYSARKFDKKIKMAIKDDIKFAILLNKDSKIGSYTLKDLVTGKEQVHSIERISNIVKDSKK